MLVGSECFRVKREMNVFERNIVGREWDGVRSAASAVGLIIINMLYRREAFFLIFKLDLSAIEAMTQLLRTRFACTSIDDCSFPGLHHIDSKASMFSSVVCRIVFPSFKAKKTCR